MNKPQKTGDRRYRPALAGLAILILLVPLLSSGCARLRLPRIDPSGNSIFLPAPNTTQLLLPGSAPNTVPAAAGTVADPGSVANLPGLFQPAPMTQPGANGMNSGNLTGLVPANNAPTAISPVRPATTGTVEPAFQPPPVPPPCNAERFERKKHLIPDPNRRLSQAEAGQLIMTPSRIVAPVGSEVVVLAGVCGSDGRFLKNQPLEWMLSNNSVGEFIEVGGMHHPAFNQLVRPTAKKINGQYARGRTGLKRVVLSRGTPTPLDDIELREGQTYVSVASASSGTSYVTGVAPNAEGWDRRRAIAVIHWVDASWSIPVPSTATAGTVAPLTTVVSRTDGSGVQDWTVRYSIVGGAPAEFEPSGSQTATAQTDRDGRGTVQIRQPAGKFEPGTTQIRVDVVRPPIYGEPELIVESGITSITWSAPALTIRAIGPRQVERKTPFEYRIEITNPGDQVARDVIVRTKDLNDSIDFISSTPKSTQYGSQYEWNVGDIAPNATAKIIAVQLSSESLGNVGLCFEVVSRQDGLQTEACAQTEVIDPCINLVVKGPTTARVNDSVNFDLRVENRCDQALRNVEMTIRYDPGLSRPGKMNPTTIRDTQGGGVLQVNDSFTFPFSATVVGQGQQCFDVTVTADGVRPKRETICINVAPAGGAIAAPPQAGEGPLAITSRVGQPITFNQPAVETRTPVVVQVTNRSNAPIENAVLILKPSPALILGYGPRDLEFRQAGQEWLTTLPRIGPGQTLDIETEFIGTRNDPNATLELSVSSPQGISATGTAQVPAATPAGNNLNAEPNLTEPPIGIPEENGNPNLGNSGQPAGDQGVNTSAAPLVVEVRALDAQLRPGERTVFNFRVTNNTNQTLTGVLVDLVIPNTLQFGETENFQNSAGLQIQPGDKLSRIEQFPPGTTNESRIELRAGNLIGPATFQVQVSSNETRGEFSDTATVQIGN